MDTPPWAFLLWGYSICFCRGREGTQVEHGLDMKYTAFELDFKQRRFRVGACAMWALVIGVLGIKGSIVLGLPYAAYRFLKGLGP